MIAIIVTILVLSVLAFLAGLIIAYAVTSQEARDLLLNLEIEINTLRARDLPPRVLEVWHRNELGAQRGVYLRSIDADKAVDALALVANGTRLFSEAGLQGVLTRRELAALRRELLESGYAQWANDDRRQGIEWTTEGRALLATCQNESVRARAYTPGKAKRDTRRGVGEGLSYV